MNPINSKVVNSIESVWSTAWGDRWENMNLHIKIPVLSFEKQKSMSYYDAIKLVMKYYDES